MQDKPTMLLGPPGTGKTTELLKIVEWLIAEGTSPLDIAFIAFTRKAANEAKSRAMEKFNFTNDSLPWFRTLHSLAFAQLNIQRSEVMGIGDYFKLAEMLGLYITAKGLSDDGTLTGLSKGDRLFFMENMARARNMDLKVYWEENPDEDIYWHELERVRDTILEYKRINGKIDFTDMVHRFVSEGQCPAIKILFVDEAQDLSPIQWMMVQALIAVAEEVYIAGDDDQAIFRWAGADVDYFINYDANKRVLGQSYRIPSKIQEVANRIITQVEKRIPKEWSPRSEEGQVEWITDVDQVDMSQGTWLLLGRNAYLLERYKQFCMQMGFLFESSIGSPIKGKSIEAIRAWEILRKGNQISLGKVKVIYEHMTTKVGVAYGMKTRIDREDEKKLVSLQDLRDNFGLLTEAIWHQALDKIDATEREYFIAALKRGEKLMRDPRIRINTIHGVKGGEAENVVIQLDMADRTYQEYQKFPDDEHRVWYVAVTRAKQNLFIIQPQTDRSYML